MSCTFNFGPEANSQLHANFSAAERNIDVAKKWAEDRADLNLKSCLRSVEKSCQATHLSTKVEAEARNVENGLEGRKTEKGRGGEEGHQ